VEGLDGVTNLGLDDEPFRTQKKVNSTSNRQLLAAKVRNGESEA
jgi:hypothetical protein